MKIDKSTSLVSLQTGDLIYVLSETNHYTDRHEYLGRTKKNEELVVLNILIGHSHYWERIRAMSSSGNVFNFNIVGKATIQTIVPLCYFEPDNEIRYLVRFSSIHNAVEYVGGLNLCEDAEEKQDGRENVK